MLTINQTLNSTDSTILGRTALVINDSLHEVSKVIPQRPIYIDVIDTEYITRNGHYWQCQHASTTHELFEHYDHYAAAVTGEPQPLTFESVEICNSCGAMFSDLAPGWNHGE